MQPKTHKEALKRIEELESASDLSTASIDDMHVWPMIRSRIFGRYCFPHHHRPTSADLPVTGVALRDTTKSWFGKIAGRTQSLKVTQKAEKDLSQALTEIVGAEVLFFSRQQNYQDQYGGLSFDRYVDPLFDFVTGRTRCAKFWFQSNWMAKSPEPANNGVAVPSSMRRSLVDKRGISRRLDHSIAQVFHDLDQVHRDCFNEPFELGKEMVGTIVEIATMRRVFRHILERAGPRLVMFPCYYAPQQTALTAACRDLAIPTVDIQHGKQGPANVNYNHWVQVPEGGFNTVADFFWVWNQQCADNITIGRQPGVNRHRPVVGGNLLLKKWRDDPPTGYRSERKELWQQIDGAAKSILVTLQPLDIDRLKMSPIWSCIERASADWIWIIKVHPNDPVNNERWHDNISKWTCGAKNFLVIRDANVPLYGLMREIDAHITYFSTTCFEALAFGIRSIVIGSEAGELYTKEIDDGVFRHVLETDDMLDLIQEPDNERKAISTNASYEANAVVAEAAIAELMKYTSQ